MWQHGDRELLADPGPPSLHLSGLVLHVKPLRGHGAGHHGVGQLFRTPPRHPTPYPSPYLVSTSIFPAFPCACNAAGQGETRPVSAARAHPAQPGSCGPHRGFSPPPTSSSVPQS